MKMELKNKPARIEKRIEKIKCSTQPIDGECPDCGRHTTRKNHLPGVYDLGHILHYADGKFFVVAKDCTEAKNSHIAYKAKIAAKAAAVAAALAR
jgi:hypothetical protein